MFLATDKTLVTLANGELLKIEEVKIGHTLLGRNGTNVVLGVKHTAKLETVWKVSCLSGFTADQLIYTEDGWCALNPKKAREKHEGLHINQLMAESSIVTQHGVFPAGKLESVLSEVHPILVTLELDGDHTFFVNDVLVHNLGGGGSAPSTSTTVQKSDPPAYLQPYLTDIAKQAQTAYQAVPQGGFSGSLVANPTPAQTGAVNHTLSFAHNLDTSGFGNDTAALGADLANKVTSGSYTAPASNTYHSPSIGTTADVNSYLQPVLQNLQENILPGVTSAAVANGAYGGNRYTTELGHQINDNFTTKAADIASQIGYGEQVRQDQNNLDAWKTNQQITPELQKNELTAAGLQPTIASSGVSAQLTPESLAASAGNQQQLWNQDQLDQAYQEYILSTQTPFAGLGDYAGIVGGNNVGGTVSGTSTGTVPHSNNFISGALGGGAAAYGLSSAFPALAGLGGPFGLIGGALLGGLLSS